MLALILVLIIPYVSSCVDGFLFFADEEEFAGFAKFLNKLLYPKGLKL